MSKFNKFFKSNMMSKVKEETREERKKKTPTENVLWNQKAWRMKTNANVFGSIVFSNLNERMAELSRYECKFKQFFVCILLSRTKTNVNFDV